MSKEAEENLRRQIERQRFDIDMLKFKLENCQSENAALRKALEAIAGLPVLEWFKEHGTVVPVANRAVEIARAALEVKP